jgi:hypothetical protein
LKSKDTSKVERGTSKKQAAAQIQALHATCTSSVRNLGSTLMQPISLLTDYLPLGACAVLQIRLAAHSVSQEASLCNHDTIVNTKSNQAHENMSAQQMDVQTVRP